MENEKIILNEYLNNKKLKKSLQREHVLDVFLKLEGHLTLEDIYNEVKKVYPKIGFITVYRTMKLLTNCDLCKEIKFNDGLTRYEHSYKHKSHDHLLCTKCGKCVEIFDESIYSLHNEIFAKNGFIPKWHTFLFYGICKECSKLQWI